jgi:hypothetical protein
MARKRATLSRKERKENQMPMRAKDFTFLVDNLNRGT